MIFTPCFEKRLQRRYLSLVSSHLGPSDRLAAGLHALPAATQGLSATQASYRFLSNPRIGLPALMEPLLDAAEQGAATCEEWLLVVHDWCNLHYDKHLEKKDRTSLSSHWDLGYRLQAALLLNDRGGQPIAPLSLSLEAADGIHCSRSNRVRKPQSQLDELEPVMHFVDRRRGDKSAVHIVDAQADSVGHMRRWQAMGQWFLVRRNAIRIVREGGVERSLSEVQQRLQQHGAFQQKRPVLYHGRSAEQWIAETAVILDRPARPQRMADQGKRKIVPGEPLHLRLVISEVRAKTGELLATWWLLSNLPDSVPAERIALWYYWRWRVESYFKLLKSAGQHVEQWQQTTASAVARRLLVASMACVVVWNLARNQSPEAAEVRDFLIRLSGRQMKRSRPFTEPALLAGLWVLLPMLQALEQYPIEQILRFAKHILPSASEDL